MPALFARQDATGASYLDGNVIRSAVLYADWKRGASRRGRGDISPWAQRGRRMGDRS
jgi:hypothetical protein